MIILVLKLKNIFVVPFKYLFTCEMFSLFPPNFKDKWQTFFLLALYWIIFEKKQQGILQYSKLWVSTFSWMTFCAQSETYGQIIPVVCLFIFVYFLPNSHFLLLLFWENEPYSTKWAGVGKAEPGASHTNKQNWELHTGRGPHAQSTVLRTSLERCWPGGLQGRVWDKGDGEKMAGEPTVRNENRDSWREWVVRAGHRLGQRGQWSHLTQYWSREGSIIISEIETPDLRRWRSGRNGQACCPKWYLSLLSSKSLIHLHLENEILVTRAGLGVSVTHVPWPHPLPPPKSLTLQSPHLLVLFPQPDKPFQFSNLRSYSLEKSLLQYCLSQNASFWSLKSEPWLPPPRLMPCVLQSIQGRPGPQPWALSSCPYECDLLSLQSQPCPTLRQILTRIMGDSAWTT